MPRSAAETAPPTPLVRVALHVGLEITVERADSPDVRSRIRLVTINETGASDGTDMGVHPGVCKDVSCQLVARARDFMKGLVLGADCGDATTGTALRWVRRNNELILLHAPSSDAADSMAYDEVGRTVLPTGVPLQTDCARSGSSPGDRDQHRRRP